MRSQIDCQELLGPDHEFTSAVLKAASRIRLAGVEVEGDGHFFRLAPPSEHELMQRKIRRCATMIVTDQCPSYEYRPLNDHSYEITPRR